MPLVLLISSGTNKRGESKYPGGEVETFRRVRVSTWIVFSSFFSWGYTGVGLSRNTRMNPGGY
jgi:hypothetical protein